MTIKVFRAPDLRQAVHHAQMELGPDALVLHQRQTPAERWWLFGRKEWEIVASDQPTTPPAPVIVQSPLADEKARLMEAELSDLKQSLGRLVHSANLAKLPRCGKTLTECYDQLCHRGLSPELAHDVVLAAREELSTSAQTQPALVNSAVRRQLEAGFRTRSPRAIEGTGPLVVFLFGQTGVGKTTTLIKLAARKSLIEGHRLAIINTDTQRPAAQLQIESLAKPLGIEVELATTAQALRDAIVRHGNRDAIFVDTPGIGRRDQTQLQELAAMVKIADRRQSFLVLNCSTSLDEMNQTLRSFRPLGLNGLILAKADETDLLGAAVTMAYESSIPVAYIAAGRRVPEDLETATPERLSTLLFPETMRPAEPVVARPKRARSARPAGAAATAANAAAAPAPAPASATAPAIAAAAPGRSGEPAKRSSRKAKSTEVKPA